jgi:hypothetical protein
LTAAIAASDIAFPGQAVVAVSNPGADAGASSVATVTLTGQMPANVAFVAPYGSDANPGSVLQPFLTLQHCARTLAGGQTCIVRAGTYRETVSPNSGITITSYDGEPVTVDGSDPVAAWTLQQGFIYRASVAMPLGDGEQVFVGHQMMTEARWPNGDDLFHVNWAVAQAGTTATLLRDSNLPATDWTGAKILIWSGSDPWDPQTGTVTSSQAGQLVFVLDDAAYPPYIVPQPGGYYYLYRHLGALDAPREWFYDPATSTLYFWAPGGADPHSLDVRTKQRLYAFDLSAASGVTIEHLNIFAATINSSDASANNVIDGINAEYVSHYHDLPDRPCPEPTDISPRCGPYAYWEDYIASSGILINGSNNVLKNSVISFSAGNGVSLTGSGHMVINNLIRHTGYAGNYASGISLSGTDQLVRNNTIHSDGRHGIWINDYGSAVVPHGDEISYNNIYSAAMLSADTGEIYSALRQNLPTATSIDHNWLHDTQPQGPIGSTLPGIYVDSGSGGYQISQNVLWNNAISNLVLYGDDAAPGNNQVSNNSVVDAPPGGFIWLQGVVDCGTTTVANNLTLTPIQQTLPPTVAGGSAKIVAATSLCLAVGNGENAAGATEMTASVRVGCDFEGCSSSGPPAISGNVVAASIASQPYHLTVAAGQTAAFSVVGNGSAPLSYQWLRNGVAIGRANGPNYTSTVTTADDGAVFSVRVTNALGSATSNGATLRVD